MFLLSYSVQNAGAVRTRCVGFDELSASDLYEVLALRQKVFVVEQACAYLDADGLDRDARHVLISDRHGLAAYCRILSPKVRFPTHTIGRVVVAQERRREGLGQRVVREAVKATHAKHPGAAIMLAAQAHLERFYSELGFARVSDAYDEDGIPHVDMRMEPLGVRAS